jgi:hypothetical protein
MNLGNFIFWWVFGTLGLFVLGKVLRVPVSNKILFNVSFTLAVVLVFGWMYVDRDMQCLRGDAMHPLCG